MKRISLAKILSLVVICVMLLGALALTVFATEDENNEIVIGANLQYGESLKLMYAIDNAPDGAVLKATDSKGNEIKVNYLGEKEINGTIYDQYILAVGVSVHAIDEVVTLTVADNSGAVVAVKNYSVLQYVYERLYVKNIAVGNEREMLTSLLEFSAKADLYFNETPADATFDKYQYITVTGATVNGNDPTGMYAPNSTPFANLDAIEYDAAKYELTITVNEETKTLDELKALTVGDTAINVVVSITEKAHEHSYEEVVTAPTCIAAGYTTYTCAGCGDTYTEAGDPATGHADENGDYKCDVCSAKALPEDGATLTIAQAIAMGKLFTKDAYTTQKYYITGIITEVQNTMYGNMIISDGTDSILVYGVYSYDGKTRYDALEYKPQVYDEITVYGVIGFYNAPQMKNGWMDDVVMHECDYSEEVTAPTCTANGYTTYTCDVCGDTYTGNETDALGHSFVDGACSVCGIPDTHTHVYTSKVTAPTCTEDGYTTYTCECGESYTEAGDPVTGIHVDNDGNFECDYGCGELMIPEANSTLTIDQAIALGNLYAHNTYTSGKYYVTITISEVYQTTYGNMRAKAEDGTVFTVYGTYSADGSVRYDALSYKPVVGDTITVYGIIGLYSNAPQMKNAWITNIVHECNSDVAATCTKGASCSICGAEVEGSEALGHTPGAEATCTEDQKCTVCGEVMQEATGHNYEGGTCTVCGAIEGGEPEGPKELVTFEFGENGSAAHVDGNDLGTSKSYTEGDYTLELTGMSKVYGPAYDAKGNSCIKLGTSKVVGTFTFTVADDVDQVIIRVAKYKANTTKIDVNGTAYTISGASNNGEYDEIVIDTTTTKTITFATVSGGARAMINSITYIG